MQKQIQVGLVSQIAFTTYLKLYTREQLVYNRRLQNVEKGEDDTYRLSGHTLSDYYIQHIQNHVRLLSIWLWMVTKGSLIFFPVVNITVYLDEDSSISIKSCIIQSERGSKKLKPEFSRIRGGGSMSDMSICSIDFDMSSTENGMLQKEKF